MVSACSAWPRISSGPRACSAPKGVGEEWQEWATGFLFSPALTVGGGTSQVLRNIIAERMLAFPHDVDVEQGKTWSETKGGAAVR